MPAVASAEPNVDAAVAAFKDLGLTPLTAMPSGRVVSPTVGSAENFGYRTYDQINQELANLASASPGLVTLKTAPRKSVEGREIKYVEIANNVGNYDGRPVYFDGRACDQTSDITGDLVGGALIAATQHPGKFAQSW